MANDKKFVVKNGLQTPNVSFKDSNESLNEITVEMLGTDTLSFSGDAGQLFSLTDTLSGTIFSVNDISGIPSIEVDDDGEIRLAEFAGNVSIGTDSSRGFNVYVDGNLRADSATFTNITRTGTTVTAGTYGAEDTILVITLDSSGFVDSIGTEAISTVLNTSAETGTGSVNLLDSSLEIAAGVGIDTTASSNTVTVEIDSADLAAYFSKVIVHDNTNGFVADEHIDHSGVSITAGKGLTGGGDITASRTIDIDSANVRAMFSVGDGLTYNSGTGEFTTNDGQIDHDTLINFEENEHIDHTQVSIVAGTGLTGGGTIDEDRTLNVGAGTGIRVNADDVEIDSADLAAYYSKVIVHDNTSGFVADEHVAHSGVNITAGSGLTGGGNIASSRTLNVGEGTGITVAADTVSTNDAEIVHDNLSGFVADEHVAHSGVTLTAGNGLTGGGTIAASRSFAVGEGTGITVAADAISTNDAEIVHDNLSGFVSNEHINHANVNINAGKGLTGGGDITTSRVIDIDSANVRGMFSGGTGITYNSGTGQFTTNDGEIVHDNLSGFVADEHVAHSGVSITAGNGLTGGGDITSSRTLNVGEGTGITVAADTVSTNDAEIVHDNLSGFVANEHIDHSGVSITAGKGLTGGGDITTSRTIDIDSANVRGMFSGGTGITYNSGTGQFTVVGGDGITANADEIEVTVDDATIELDATDGSGAVRVKDGGITNAKLANSSVTVGSTSIALGGTSTTLADLTQIDVDNVRILDNTVGTTSGNLILDPAPLNDSTGTVVILGDLQVDGTTTTINSTTVTISDKNIVLADSATTPAQANGAGITVNGSNATITYDGVSDRWDFNKAIEADSVYANLTASTVDIDGGTIDGVNIGSATPGSATFTGITVNNNIVVNGTVDGRDIATDGTKLDGIETGATADQTAAEILTLIKTVDGAGSGLDADTLDGIQGSGFLQTSGGTLTGALSGTSLSLSSSASGTQFIGTAQSTTAPTTDDAKFDGFGVQGNRTTNPIYVHNQGAGGVRISSNASLGTPNGILVKDTVTDISGNLTISGTVDGRDIATDGTKLDGIETGATADQTASEILTLIKTVDGIGSGLDADLLDGVQGSSYLRSDADDTTTGALTIDTTGRALLITGTGTLDAADASIYLGNAPASYGFDITYEGTGSGNTNAFVITSTNAGTPKELIRANQDGIVKLVQSGATIAGNTIWHAGNDGSGSGLDADLLDGAQSSVSNTANAIVLRDGSGNFSAGTITATLSGNASTATTATNVTASANNGNNETVYLTFVDGATGTQGIETDTGLTYNPSTGLITSTAFSGNLTGNVTGNASTASALSSAVTVALTGDVTGSATFTNAGDTASIAATIAANSVALGADTTGNYVASLTAGSLIDLQNNTGPGATPTIDVDLSELTDMTDAAVGTDELVILDAGSQKRKAINEITLGLFNTTNQIALGDDTTGNYVQQGATSGNGISGSVNSEGGTFTVTSNATNANTPSTTVFRDGSGNFSAGTITAALSGNASTASALASSQNFSINGDITAAAVGFDGTGAVALSAAITAGSIVNADINASAGIADTKLATISTAGKVSNSATTATNANTPSTIVARDASGNFSAGTITATLSGNVTGTATNANNVAITDDTTTNSTHYVHFGDATSGNDGVKVSSSKLTFNPSSGTLQVGGLTVATTADLTASTSPNFSVDSANFGTANSFTIGEGKAVYYDTTTSKWEGAYNDSAGEYNASHVIVDMTSTDVKIASSGIFTIGMSGMSANNYYFLSSTAGTTTNDPDSSPTIFQPLYYALDANTIDLNIQAPQDTVITTWPVGQNPGEETHGEPIVYSGIPSDERLKENIEAIQGNALDTVDELNPVSFDFKNPINRYQEGQQLGFIAQQILEVIPQSVYTDSSDSDATLILKPEAITPVLVKAIQELSAKVTSLEKEIEHMKPPVRKRRLR